MGGKAAPRALMVRKDPESEATEVAKFGRTTGLVLVKALLDLLAEQD